MRLRTLPLASAGVILGSFLAWNNGFSWLRFALLLGTALLLQILSNLANDYGDFKKGTDNANRTGEKRMVSSGDITPSAMLTAVVLFAVLSFVSGTLLLLQLTLTPEMLYFFYGVGILCIIAAITYTIGKKAYGYSGFGDIAVFVFFGIVSVSGTHYLLTGAFDPYILLPASAIGMLATGVLNLNNMRDHINDKNSGKNTLVVKMGFNKAKLYHTFLLSIPLVLGFLYVTFNPQSNWQWLFMLTAPILLKLSSTVKKTTVPATLDGELKKQALTTLLFAVLFAVGNLL